MIPEAAGQAPRNGLRSPVLPAAIWSAVGAAAPFLSFPAAAALPWSIGAVLLLGIFPPVLVGFLQRRGDLRRLPPSSLPSVVLGAAAMAGMVQWAILWLAGPRALSAAAFALLAAALVLMLANSFTSWSWLDLTLGAGLVILGVTASLLMPGAGGWVVAAVLVAAQAAVLVRRLRQAGPVRCLPAAAAGAVAGGGVFLWLLAYAR